MRFTAFATLALAMLLPDMASAQIFGRGRWDRGYRGGAYYDGYNGRYYTYPGYSFGFYYGNPYGYSYYYPNSTYYYSTPSTGFNTAPGSVYFDSGRTSMYYDPATNYQDPTRSTNRAYLQISLPDPNAELIIEGQKMDLTGSLRHFHSPDLEQGKTYTYTIRMRRAVSGRTDEETRTIDVKAGTNYLVDFTRPTSEKLTTPLPK